MKRFILLALCLLAVHQLRADDWPQFLGPRRDGTSLEKGLLDAFPPGGPNIVWQRKVGEGYSGPVIAGERLVLFHRVGDNEVLECLNAATGASLWKFTYATNYQDGLGKGDGPRSTPVIVGDKVVTLGAEGALHCVTLDAGKKVWSRSLTAEYKAPLGYFGIATSPVVEQNLVLVNVGGKNAGIVAFDLDTGKEIWKATNDPASYSSPVVCTVDGARLAVFFTRTGAVVLDPKTAAVRLSARQWRSRHPTHRSTPPRRSSLAILHSSPRAMRPAPCS